jgi:toluene monooxygenase system ferredoxin subunit
MNDWKVVTSLDDLWEGDLVSRTVEGVELLLVNVDGQVRAFRNRCPHAGTPLNQGKLEGPILTCSAHLWQFDIVNGGVGVNPRDCRLTSFAVRIEDGRVLVQLRPVEHEAEHAPGLAKRTHTNASELRRGRAKQ